MPHYPVSGHAEEHRRHCTALPDASLHFKAGFAFAYSACKVVVEAFDDVDNLLWYPIGPKDAPQTFLVHAVKSLLKVYKVDVELSLSLCALLYDVTQGGDLVCASLSFPKPCLLSSQFLVHCVDTADTICNMSKAKYFSIRV